MFRTIAIALLPMLGFLHSVAARDVEEILQQTGTTGGFTVHVGCGDGKLTAALKPNEAIIVHGLDTDGEKVKEAQAYLNTCNLGGTLTVAQFDGSHLPYVHNMVNLLVCARQYGLTKDEILRVLRPGGVAITPNGSVSKPWPDTYDEWTHYVYCLRAFDGALAWRFLAAPHDRRLMSEEQLESVWPVHGSVLVRNDTAYVVAGRSMFLDGGLTLYLLDPGTGQSLSSEKLTGDDPNTGENLHEHIEVLDMPVASSDVLSSVGDYVFMRSQPFDLSGKRDRVAQAKLTEQRGDDAHLFAPNGFLDDHWWHREFWVYGRSVRGGPAYWETGHATPSGKMIVLDDENLYIFGRGQDYWKWTTSTEYRLFSVSRTLPKNTEPASSPTAKQRANPKIRTPRFARRWSTGIPVLVRAMVKAGDTLFVAGPEDTVDEDAAYKAYNAPGTQESLARQAALFAGADGSVLWAVSAEDGSKRDEIKLDVLPVFDGMIAAGGRIYMSTIDG